MRSAQHCPKCASTQHTTPVWIYSSCCCSNTDAVVSNTSYGEVATEILRRGISAELLGRAKTAAGGGPQVREEG